MNIFVVNFEKVVNSYKVYQDSISNLDMEKEKFSQRVSEIRSEMESIINGSRMLVLDQSLKEQNNIRLRELQSEGIKLESEFRQVLSEKQSSILESCFSDISKIVNEWSTNNGADMVLNSNSVFFAKGDRDITDKILGVLMSKDLYVEVKEEVNN